MAPTRPEDDPTLNADVSLEARLGHRFADPVHLITALTHPSYANVAAQRGEPVADNQRLEFLGDAVLDLIVGERLYFADATADPGTLTQRRIALVGQKRLAQLGHDLTLHHHLRAGPGETRSGLPEQPSVLADAFEAVLGAIYLDGGLPAAAAAIDRLLGPELMALHSAESLKSPKVVFQELAQGRWSITPTYTLLSGAPRFHVEVKAGIHVAARGLGSTRRAAEENAARAALARLEAPEDLGQLPTEPL